MTSETLPQNSIRSLYYARKEKQSTIPLPISRLSVCNLHVRKLYMCNRTGELPESIDGGVESLPQALLAKVYVKPGLDEVDRYHAKFGDIGVRYLKRCLPNLKIPTQYRCEVCIDGKIHKFGHKACAEGMRTQYLPGVCIHTDHSGPYARSLSGARYSQLYLDRGSGYLWGVRQKRKTGHYDSTPQIFTDAWGLWEKSASISVRAMVCSPQARQEKCYRRIQYDMNILLRMTLTLTRLSREQEGPSSKE
jgi:hypothetical protein